MAPLNLLILMDDQHRHDALGCAAQGIAPDQRTWLMGHGNTPVQTPHLDRLAASGIRFSEAVANLPVCVPCRHSFITGLYPHQTGILANSHYWPDQPPVPTLSTYLKQAGYATAAIGKMHWKSRHAPAEHVPDKRGFDFRVSAGNASDGPRDRDYADTLSDDGRYKLIERLSARGALYDLREDPNEFSNRIDEPGLADVRERLRESLIRGVLTRAEQFPAQQTPIVAIARGPVVSPER